MPDALTLTGVSGRTYTLERYSFRSSWNSVPAVYAVLNGRVLYVGQTDNLKERFANHHCALGFVLHSATHVAVLREGSEEMRRAIETDLVSNYRPPLNQTAHG